MQALGSRRKKIYRRLTEGVMSSLYGKWNVEDVRDVIHGLDEKTGMDGASISIFMSKKLRLDRIIPAKIISGVDFLSP